jgi:hypothetical protein
MIMDGGRIVKHLSMPKLKALVPADPEADYAIFET